MFHITLCLFIERMLNDGKVSVIATIEYVGNYPLVSCHCLLGVQWNNYEMVCTLLDAWIFNETCY